MSEAIAKLTPDAARSIEAADKLLSEHHALALDTKRHVTQALMQAELIEKLHAALSDEVMQRLMVLKDTSLGFRTDEISRLKKGDKPYAIQDIRRCMVEAALKGAAIINNEFNVIAANTYLTQNFFTRKLREMEGLTDLQIGYGVPRVMEGGALVEVTATWKFKGAEMTLQCTGGNAIAVRLNVGQGADAALGKAERKIKARIYERITGSSHEYGEVDDAELRPVSGVVVEQPKSGQPKTEALAHALEQKVGAAQAQSGSATIPSTPAAKPAPAPAPIPTPKEFSVLGFNAVTPTSPVAPPQAAAAQAPTPVAQPTAPAPVAPEVQAAAVAAEQAKPKGKAKTAAPTPADIPQVPMDEPEGGEAEEEEATVTVESVRRRARKEKRDNKDVEVFYFAIIDDKATEYFTSARELAQVAKLGKETKRRVLLKYREHKQETGPVYWASSVTVLEAEPQKPEPPPPETAAMPETPATSENTESEVNT